MTSLYCRIHTSIIFKWSLLCRLFYIIKLYCYIYLYVNILLHHFIYINVYWGFLYTFLMLLVPTCLVLNMCSWEDKIILGVELWNVCAGDN